MNLERENSNTLQNRETLFWCEMRLLVIFKRCAIQSKVSL